MLKVPHTKNMLTKCYCYLYLLLDDSKPNKNWYLSFAYLDDYKLVFRFDNGCIMVPLVSITRTGIVKINTMQCIGCRSCNFACPISIPHYDPILKISLKCDLCEGDPWCVKFCTTGALHYIPRKEARKLIKS